MSIVRLLGLMLLFAFGITTAALAAPEAPAAPQAVTAQPQRSDPNAVTVSVRILPPFVEQ
jgi:hypothetical protein